VKVRFAISGGLGELSADRLHEVVTGAEDRGFDTIWFSDLPMVPSTDPFLAVSFAAACSKRVKLGVNLVPFGYEPFVFARQVAELDRLTGGRLLVTLVPGLDQAGERAALGIGAADRGRLLDARIPLLRAWWAGEVVAPPGHAEAVRLGVRPRQDPLEVWLGGSGPRAIRRAGRLADGWLGSLVTPARAGEILAEIAREAAAAGRRIDPEHFGLSIPYVRDPDDVSAVRAIRRPGNEDEAQLVPVGADGLRSLVAQLVDQGLSKFVVRPVGNVRTWSTELDWLADALLDLET
jgi:probable F420-dependent oxidoreductase